MSEKEYISESKKYKVIVENDDSGEKKLSVHYGYVNGERVDSSYEVDKYKIVKVIRIEDNHIIYQYKQHNTTTPFSSFEIGRAHV